MRSKPLINLPKDEPLDISRDQMTLLMMESYKKSSTSQEEIMCLREVAKMNGLYEKVGTTVNILNLHQNVQKLESMSDDELLKLAGSDERMFEQVEHIVDDRVEDDSIEAEYTEVDDGESG